jgi:hypothetical protein
MRFGSPVEAALVYCICRLIVRSDNRLLLKVETGFCSRIAHFSGVLKEAFVINETQILSSKTVHLKNNRI